MTNLYEVFATAVRVVHNQHPSASEPDLREIDPLIKDLDEGQCFLLEEVAEILHQRARARRVLSARQRRHTMGD